MSPARFFTLVTSISYLSEMGCRSHPSNRGRSKSTHDSSADSTAQRRRSSLRADGAGRHVNRMTVSHRQPVRRPSPSSRHPTDVDPVLVADAILVVDAVLVAPSILVADAVLAVHVPSSSGHGRSRLPMRQLTEALNPAPTQPSTPTVPAASLPPPTPPPRPPRTTLDLPRPTALTLRIHADHDHHFDDFAGHCDATLMPRATARASPTPVAARMALATRAPTSTRRPVPVFMPALLLASAPTLRAAVKASLPTIVAPWGGSKEARRYSPWGPRRREPWRPCPGRPSQWPTCPPWRPRSPHRLK